MTAHTTFAEERPKRAFDSEAWFARKQAEMDARARAIVPARVESGARELAEDAAFQAAFERREVTIAELTARLNAERKRARAGHWSGVGMGFSRCEDARIRLRAAELLEERAGE